VGVRRLVPLLRVLLVVLLGAIATGCHLFPAPVPTPVPAGVGQLQVMALAEPVCPAEQEPSDPACVPRAVPGALVFVQPADGRDILVAQTRANADGVAVLDLPAGDYVVLGGDVEGLMRRPEPTHVSIAPHETLSVELLWDTGVR
jgi:hypothetical protein